MAIESTSHWYVMTLLNMKSFRDLLKVENAQRLSVGRAIIEPFYPADFLKEQMDSSTVRKTAVKPFQGRKETDVAVSDYFANIVFLKGTEGDIDNLVDDNRNKHLRIGLRHYLDTDGSNAIVHERMMQDFLQACVKYRGRFEIVPPLTSIELWTR